MSGYWIKVPGHVKNVLRGQTGSPYGPQGGYWTQEWVEYEWVETSLLEDLGDPDPWFSILICGFVVVVLIVAFAIYTYSTNAYNEKAYNSVQNGITSTWDGFDHQYAAYQGTAKMILTIDSIKKGSFYGKINWQWYDTITKVVGTITKDVSNTKDARWKYVTSCSNKEIYLQFTETKFIQDGDRGVILNVKYYAVVCDGTLSGVWFYPDQPNGSPGGDFSLPWKSP